MPDDTDTRVYDVIRTTWMGDTVERTFVGWNDASAYVLAAMDVPGDAIVIVRVRPF